MTLKVYGSTDTSTRKSKRWLDDYNITYDFRNIINHPLEEDEIKEILGMTEAGTEEIIATKSNIYKELNIDFDSIPLKQFLSLVNKFPRLLRQPIIVGVNKLQIGFDSHDIRKFIPRDYRKKIFAQYLSIG